MAKLTLYLGSSLLSEMTLVKDITTIGRSDDNDVTLDNLSASGHHARIVKTGTQYTVEDVGSTNGTLVNGQKLTSKVLENNDVIAIGKHELRFIGDNSEHTEKASDFEKTVFVRMPSASGATPTPPPSVPKPTSNKPVPVAEEKSAGGGMVKIIGAIVVLLAIVVVGYLMMKMK